MCGETRMKHSKLSKSSSQTKTICMQSIQQFFLIGISCFFSLCAFLCESIFCHHHIAFWTLYQNTCQEPQLPYSAPRTFFFVLDSPGSFKIQDRTCLPGFNVTCGLGEFYHINIGSSTNFEHISIQHIFWILGHVFLVQWRFRSKH